MTGPLVILAILSVVGGWIGWPQALGGANSFGNFLEPMFAQAKEILPHGAHHSHATEYLLMALSIGLGVAGFIWAFRWYLTRSTGAEKVKTCFAGFYKVVLNKSYIDEFYHTIIVRPLVGGSRLLWKKFDELVIDGAVNGLASLIRQMGRGGAAAQAGNFRGYAMVFLGGAVILIAWLFYFAGRG